METNAETCLMCGEAYVGSTDLGGWGTVTDTRHDRFVGVLCPKHAIEAQRLEERVPIGAYTVEIVAEGSS